MIKRKVKKKEFGASCLRLCSCSNVSVLLSVEECIYLMRLSKLELFYKLDQLMSIHERRWFFQIHKYINRSKKYFAVTVSGVCVCVDSVAND